MVLAAAGVFSLGVFAAFGIAPDTQVETVPTRAVLRELPVPEIEAALPDDDIVGFWREERVQRGDTLGSLLARLEVSDPAAFEYLRTSREARPVYQLRPGRGLRVRTDADGALLEMRMLTAQGELLTVRREGSGFRTEVAQAPLEPRLRMASGDIRSSLFGAADAAGLPDSVTMQIAEIFSGDIDFYHDLRKGDRFSVVYEVLHLDGEPVRAGRVVAAEFENNGRRLEAFRYDGPDGQGGYYGADGRNLRKAFLRSPMEFSRITSGFSLARMHPIFQTWRAHKGVDYAAPTGTPVRATGDAKVAFVGRQGGYGNVVILQHQGSYSTVYAHLSGFASGLRAGARVAQGDLIGYVGSTGWATGPHLHYEFRVHGEARNPQAIALPAALPIPAEHRAGFLASIEPLRTRLVLASRSLVAQGD